jgi:hypothetical protein
MDGASASPGELRATATASTLPRDRAKTEQIREALDDD